MTGHDAFGALNRSAALARYRTLLALLAFVAIRAFAGTVTLAWDPVSSPALAGYKVYYGPASGTYTASIDVGNVTTYTVSNLVAGATYYFAATAYDSAHSESGFSNEAAATVPSDVLVAQFYASATSGVAPLALNFTSTSTGTITGYAWTFGDGGSSGSQNPSHVYFGTGAYTVSLTVTGPGGSNTLTRANYVTVSPPGAVPTATSLQSNPNPSQVGAVATFTATVVGSSPGGSVGFTDGANPIGGCAASALAGIGNVRTAVCSTASLSVGTHSIVAIYSGDALNSASSGTPLSQVVNASSSSALVNGSFEVPALGSGYQYQPSGGGVGWSFGVGSGIEGDGSAWSAAKAPDGSQAAFIQGTATMAQSVNLAAGSYALSFQAAQRVCCSAPFVQPIRVTVDGVQVGSLVSPPSTAFTAFSVRFSLSTSGPHTIAFTGTDGSGDKSTFIDAVTLVASALLVNGSFEVPALGGGYQYQPSGGGVGWSFGVDSGIEGDGSAWSAAKAPDGSQTAFIQGTATMAQTVNLAAGSYALSFQAAQRACCSAPFVQPISVTVDGVQVGSLVSPPSTDFTAFSVRFSLSSSGPHTIAFTGTDASGDRSTFIDAVTLDVVSSPTLVNGSFEVPALGSGYQYEPSGGGVGWSFGVGSGIEGDGSAWAAAKAPDGSQAAFIQGTATMAQTVNLAAGSYTLSFQAAQRACCSAPFVQPISVTVDGAQVGSLVLPPSTDFTVFSIPFQVSTSGPHTIAFTGTDGSGDRSTFIDTVGLN